MKQFIYEQDNPIKRLFSPDAEKQSTVNTEPSDNAVTNDKPVVKQQPKKTEEPVVKRDTDRNTENPVNKPGSLKRSDRAKNDKINPILLKDLETATKKARIGDVTITTAKTGHNRKVHGTDTDSRHWLNCAVDISIINGVSLRSNKSLFTKLGTLLVNQLKDLGYVLNEGSNKKSYLWQTAGHYDHIHVSVLPSWGEQLRIHREISKIYRELYDALTKRPEAMFSAFKSVYDPSYLASSKKGQLITSDDEQGAAKWFKYNYFEEQYGEKLKSWEKNKYTHTNDIINIKTIRKVVDIFYDAILNGKQGSFLATYYFHDPLKGWYTSKINYVWNYM